MKNLGRLLVGAALLLGALILVKPGEPPVHPVAAPVVPTASPVSKPAPVRPFPAPEEPVFSSNPVVVQASVFSYPSVQPGMLVATATFHLLERAPSAVEQVKLRIPSWDVDDVLLDKRGEPENVTRYWYEGQPHRPDGRTVEMEVVGVRGGEEVLLYRGWLDGRAVAP